MYVDQVTDAWLKEQTNFILTSYPKHKAQRVKKNWRKKRVPVKVNRCKRLTKSVTMSMCLKKKKKRVQIT